MLCPLRRAYGCDGRALYLESLQDLPARGTLAFEPGDYLGQPDPKRDLALRLRRFTPGQRMALAHARRAGARLRLDIVSLSTDGLRVAAAAELLPPARVQDAALYLAAYEARLEDGVRVVLEWQGPLPFSEPTLRAQRLLPLLPKALPANSGVVGFVQNRRTAEVLQVLRLGAC
jgi:hypothetical protein